MEFLFSSILCYLCVRFSICDRKLGIGISLLRGMASFFHYITLCILIFV